MSNVYASVQAVVDSIEKCKDAMKWLDDALEIVPMYHRDKSLDSVRALVAFGGPNIWVTFKANSWWARVDGQWSFDEYTQNAYVGEMADLIADLYGNMD